PRCVENAGMVELVEDHGIAAVRERGDDAEVGLISGREDERRLLADKGGELGLELLVQIERAVQQTAAGAAGSIAPRGPFGLREHARIVREPEIVVRTEHDLAGALDDALAALRPGDRHEVGMQAGGLRVPGMRVPRAALKEVDVGSTSCVKSAGEPRLASANTDLRPREAS